MSEVRTSRFPVLAASAAIVALAAIAYSNSFSGPFVLDDVSSITENTTIRSLWPLTGPLAPPGNGLTVQSRPVLNLSLALNYWVSGNRVGSYHVGNLLIHLLSGLTLFGIVRRTLQLKRGDTPAGEVKAAALAFAVAVVWTVHPLQTESVTYVVQRAESLMGLWYLLTLYGFIRSATQGTAWAAAFSVGACFLGMGTKEVMVSAPLVVLMYDRTYVSGSIRNALSRRRGYYLCLASSWVLLVALVVSSGGRGGTSGLGSGIGPIDYWLTQPPAVVRYLHLAFWPRPLIFDYGTAWTASTLALVLAALWVSALFAVTLAACRARPAWGFLGLCFFAVLAPTSLVPGNRQTLAEHRMYLALIPLVVAVFVALGGVVRRPLWIVGCALLVAVPSAMATYRRNEDYATARSLFAHDVANLPGNPFARANFGVALLADDEPAQARDQLSEAIRLRPIYPIAEDGLGTALLLLGGREDAESHFRRAIQEDPGFAGAHSNLGYALLDDGRSAEAQAEIDTALRLDPHFPEARNNLARLWVRSGRLAAALAEYEAILRDAPDFAKARNDYGIALSQSSRPSEAVAQYREAIRGSAAYPEAHYNLANALAGLGRLPEAVSEYETALNERPAYVSARNNLGNVLRRQRRFPDAVKQFEAALATEPADPLTHYNLANVLLDMGRTDEAVGQYREALRLRPDFEPARQLLSRLRPGP